MLGPDGRVRVIDFGIALADDASRVTRVDQQVGTFAYMSPEQVEGWQVGPASDVFALGALAYIAATGHEAFGAPTPRETFANVTFARYDDRRLADPRVRAMIAACLRPDPAARPTPALLESVSHRAISDPSAVRHLLAGGDASDGSAVTVVRARQDPLGPTESHGRNFPWRRAALGVVVLLVVAGTAAVAARLTLGPPVVSPQVSIAAETPGLNRTSQHSDHRGVDGTSAGMDGHTDGAAGDGVARPSADSSRSQAGVLAPQAAGNLVKAKTSSRAASRWAWLRAGR